ncbi:uncharacterized protein LOC126912259 [Spodoptera frugiperda]|uniref:Uncharacterized protein LOC126912259 n=1 Tax=Spodoptera frugiperda TaxID=7108 RepID=A0A9R0F210_SPOFR|nr:uncharacterized protein LOC126912259 [Spodoptera frugiperda]
MMSWNRSPTNAVTIPNEWVLRLQTDSLKHHSLEESTDWLPRMREREKTIMTETDENATKLEKGIITSKKMISGRDEGANDASHKSHGILHLRQQNIPSGNEEYDDIPTDKWSGTTSTLKSGPCQKYRWQ